MSKQPDPELERHINRVQETVKAMGAGGVSGEFARIQNGALAAEDVFEQQVHSREEVAAKFTQILGSVEDQRLVAWVEMRAAGGDRMAREKYTKLCAEQRRLTRAVEQWRAANPAPVEEE